jgi:hypothetical protein
MLLAIGCLVALAVASVAAAVRPGPVAYAAVGVCSVAWWLTNGPIEGPILWTVVPEKHGLTLADLAAPAAWLAVAVAVRWRRR